MAVDTYKVAYGPVNEVELRKANAEDGVVGKEPIIAIDRTPAYRVQQHFAVREIFAPHSCGEELWVRGGRLDHIPTGLCAYVHRGFFGVSTEEACEAFAASIAALPVDWSSDDPKVLDLAPFSDFVRKAQEAAGKHESIEWSP